MARASTTSDVFNAIAEPKRRLILELLSRKGSLAVGAMVATLGMPQPDVSKHLSVLRKVGLVATEKNGRERIYTLNPRELKTVHDWVSHFEKLWSQQLDRIKVRAEKKAKGRPTSPI